MNPKIKMVIAFMHANLHRKLSLAEFAESASISVSHLGHLFKTETGVSPGHYLMTLRVQRAGDLLKSSIVSVKRIMFEVGFNDKSNFVRSFRKAYGLSPSEYRAKNFDPIRAPRDRKIDQQKVRKATSF